MKTVSVVVRETDPEGDDAPTIRDVTIVYPAASWYEELGDVLWWNFPVKEGPHLGSPLELTWPGDRWTHYSLLPVVCGSDGMPLNVDKTRCSVCGRWLAGNELAIGEGLCVLCMGRRTCSCRQEDEGR